MLTDFIFDADKLDAFVQVWNDNIGVLHASTPYNGWAFLDDDGRLIDLRITDVNGEWVAGDDPFEREHRGWDWLTDKAVELKATNILNIHNHAPEDSGQPCNHLMPLIESAINVLEPLDITIRAIVALHGGELEGAMWAERIEDDEADAMRANLISEGNDLMAELAKAAADGDQFAAAILPVMQRIQDALARGEEPDHNDLTTGAKISAEALIASLGANVPTVKEPKSVFDLPMLDIKNSGLLN